jgi:hypothetical protein
MADDMYGFRDDGFVLPGAVRFGWHRDGTGEEMDGFFALDTGGNCAFNRKAWVARVRLRLDWGSRAIERTPSLVCR